MRRWVAQQYSRWFPPGSILRQLFIFGVGGVLAFLIYTLCALVAFYVFHLHYLMSTVLAFLLSSVVSFTWHRTLTFASNRKIKHAYPGFVLVQSAGLAVNVLLVHIQVYHLHWSYGWSLPLPVLVSAIITYVMNRWVIF